MSKIQCVNCKFRGELLCSPITTNQIVRIKCKRYPKETVMFVFDWCGEYKKEIKVS